MNKLARCDYTELLSSGSAGNLNTFKNFSPFASTVRSVSVTKVQECNVVLKCSLKFTTIKDPGGCVKYAIGVFAFLEFQLQCI